MLYFWIALLCLSPVWANQSLISGNDNHVKWTRPNVPLVIKIQPNDQPYQIKSEVQNVIESSILEWNRFSDVKVISSSNTDSKNSISFKSNFPYGSGVLGVTEVTHDASGVIESAKILINNDHNFLTAPITDLNISSTYLGDVVTHEIGHFLGMAHSEVLDATMFYSSFKDHHILGRDDVAGIRGKYQDYNFGKIFGTIKGGNHIGVLGTHVQAISRNTGKAIGAISKEDGSFEILGLDVNDTYYLYTSPLKNPANMPEYFSNSQKMFCPAAYEGSFFSECGDDNKGKPAGINLTQVNSEMNVGVVTINCGYKTHNSYLRMKYAETKEPLNLKEQAFAGWFEHPKPTDTSPSIDYSTPEEYNIKVNSMFKNYQWKPELYLRVSLVVHAFGAELDTILSVLPSVATSTNVPGTNNQVLDIKLNSASDLDYKISVSSKKQRYKRYTDMFPIATDSRGAASFPYLLTFGLYEKVNDRFVPYMNTEASLSDNSSCLEGPFTKATKATRTKIEKISTKDSQLAAPSCGTIDPPSNSGPGSTLMLVCLGFMASLLTSMAIKSRKKLLS